MITVRILKQGEEVENRDANESLRYRDLRRCLCLSNMISIYNEFDLSFFVRPSPPATSQCRLFWLDIQR